MEFDVQQQPYLYGAGEPPIGSTDGRKAVGQDHQHGKHDWVDARCEHGCVRRNAVLGAVVLQRTRSKLSTETLLSSATATFAAIVLSLALLRTPAILCFLMLFGGASWTAIMSLFNIMVQEFAPDWVRARVLAVYLFVFQGSVTVGSTLWG